MSTSQGPFSTSFKHNFYVISHLVLMALGLAFSGMAIFLLSRAVDTVSQAMALTAIYYTACAVFGGLAHRYEKSNWYKMQAVNLTILASTQIFVVLALGFAWGDILNYLTLVDGGDRQEISETVKFLADSRPAFFTIFSITIVKEAFTAFISMNLHYDTYKKYIAAEYNRLFNSGRSNHEKNGESMMHEEYEAIQVNNQELHRHHPNDATQPLIVDAM